MYLSTSPTSSMNGPNHSNSPRRASAPPISFQLLAARKGSNPEVVAASGNGSTTAAAQAVAGGSGFSILGFGRRKSSNASTNGQTPATSGTSLHLYPASASPTMTASTNMYALHEYGESHDENSENDSKKSSRVDNIATPDDINTAEDECTNNDSTNDDCQPSKINPNASVNFNMEGLKDMLKCANCHRFLFPPILQCLNGHMECRICFDVKPQCGKCHQKIVEVPAKFAEFITEQFNVQCSYAEKGCTESVAYKNRRDHEEICPYKPVQCPEFDCTETRPMNEIFKHFRLEHHHHFVNAHGSIFNGDIRCDDSNMIMGVERKWAPTMMKIEEDEPGTGTQHFFLEILRTKHGVWHMWVWYLGEPDDAGNFKCDIAIKKRNVREEESELKYSGRVHSIRIPPHRIILSGCLLSFSDYTAAHFRYIGEGHQGHPVIDYKVSVSRNKRQSQPPSNERVMAAGLSKMFRRFSIDTTGPHHKSNKNSLLQQEVVE